MPAIVLVLGMSFPCFAQQSAAAASQDKPLEVQSSIADLHLGKDANAEKAGLPLYPGAHPKQADGGEALNLRVLTESFGLKLVVAKYESDDPPAKILGYHCEKMKKYGKVLACDSANDKSGWHSDSDQDDLSKPLTCEGENKGPVRELKVGTEGNTHIVAIEPQDGSKGMTFSIVYLHRRGKSGDI